MERKSIFKKILSMLTAGVLSISLMTGIPFWGASLGITAGEVSDPKKLVFDVSEGSITIGDGTISYGSDSRSGGKRAEKSSEFRQADGRALSG